MNIKNYLHTFLLCLGFCFIGYAEDEPPLVKDEEGNVSIGKVEEKSFKIHLSSEKPSDTKVDNKTSSKSENSSKEVELAEKSKDKEVKVANLIYNKKILQINTEEANRYFKRSEEKLDKAIQDFEIALEAENKNNVEDRKSSYKRLKEQINVRNELIIHIGKLERASIHGFGRKAFQEASLELNYLHLTQRYVFVQVEEQIEKVKSQSRFYILPFLFSFIYLIAWWYGLRFWRKQLCNFLKSYDRSDYMLAKPIWRATPWFIYELQKPIALVLFTYFFIIIVGKPFDISDIGPVTYLITASLLGNALVCFFLAVNKRYSMLDNRRKMTRQLRQKTVKVFGLLIVTFTVLGGFLKNYNLTNGSLSYWVKFIYIILLLAISVRALYWWQQRIQRIIQQPEYGNNSYILWLRQNIKKSFKLPALILSVIYISMIQTLRLFLVMSGESDTFKALVAYLFRMEIKRQAQYSNHTNELTRLQGKEVEVFAENNRTRSIERDIVANELDILMNYLQKKRGSISILIGERGSGKTTLLNHIYHSYEQKAIKIEVSPNLSETLSLIQKELGQPNLIKTYIELKKTDRIFLLYHMSRMISPSVGGLENLQILTRIMRNGNKAKWILSSNLSSWQFVDKARGERFKFHNELYLPKWEATQLAGLIDKRNDLGDIKPDFSGMKLPTQLDSQELDEEDKPLYQYARILEQYSGGNPGVALHLWSLSLYKKSNGKIVVRLFEPENIDHIDKKELVQLIILRSILQMELAHINSIASATGIAKDHILNLLKSLSDDGIIIETESCHYQISWHWYRTVTNVLKRKHLLS